MPGAKAGQDRAPAVPSGAMSDPRGKRDRRPTSRQPPAATTERIEQSVCFVDQSMKREALAALLEDPKFYRTLVFTRTKHGADRVVKHLVKEGVKALAIHGNKSQGQRERALQGFRDGSTPVLVATDIAARGIDVPEVTHVVNFDLPNIPAHRFILDAWAAGDLAVAPPLRAFQEEKLALALFHHPRLRDFWAEALTAGARRTLSALIPPSWIVDPAPLPPGAVLDEEAAAAAQEANPFAPERADAMGPANYSKRALRDAPQQVEAIIVQVQELEGATGLQGLGAALAFA